MGAGEGLTDFSNIDFELFEEYAAGLDEAIAIIETGIRKLGEQPDDFSLVTLLFRSFHNLKGDAALCRFELGMQVTHQIESILMRLRDGQLRFTPLLGEALLLAVDRLELSVDAVLSARPVPHLQVNLLIDTLGQLVETPSAGMDQAAVDMIERVSGFRPASETQPPARPAAPLATQESGGDLAFFRAIALQLEQRSHLFEGRTDRLLRLTRAMNDLGGTPVDPTQLEAAVYLHDVGMMLLPEPLWLKPGRLSDGEWAQMRLHTGYGAGLLERIPGWREAARIIAQHHEMPDGKGYPQGLRAPEIHPGAKIMAIADAFEAVMLKHRHRGQNLSVLRAAAEINACESQFAQEWIGPFNQAVRKML